MSFAVAMYFMLELEEGEAKKNNVKERLYRPQAKSNLNNPELEESLFYEKEPIKIEFECICRICQNAGEISIFDKSRNRDIANDIKSCANVEIENDDGLPSHICVECLDLLDIALLFKSKCEEMDAHLRVTLSEMKQEKIKKNNLHAQVKFLKTERSKIYKKDIRPNLKIIKPDEIKKLKYIENVNYDLLKPISAEEDNMPAEDNYGKIGQNVMHAVASYKKVESNRKPEYNTSVGGNYSEGQVSNVKEKYCHIIGDKLAKINQPVIVENNLHAQNKLAEIEEDTWNEKKLLTKAERMETQLAIIDRKDTFLQTKASKMQRAKIEEKKTMLRVRIEKLKQVRINNKRAYLQAKIEQEREKNDSLTQAKFGKKEQLSIEQQKFETTDQKIENDHTDNLAGVGVGGEKDTFEDDFFSDKEGVSQKPNHVSNSNKPDNRRNMTDGFVDCFKCYLCFYDRKEYKMHLATCQLDRRKLLCSYRRKIPEKLPWMCHICGKRFKHRPAFDDHRATHSYNLPFACDKCPYRGRTIEVLRIHSRVHTGYRPYKCTLCSKAFINSSNRNKHILVHDTNRPFKCQKCKKTFRTELIMNKHIHVVHDGANQVECDLCGVRLSSRSSIVKHKKIVHKIMPSQRSRRAIYLQVMAKEQAAQSEIENRQANASKARKKRTNLERREPTPTLLDVTDTDTVNVQTSEVEMLCRICGEVTDNVSIFQNRGDRNIVKDITTIASVQIEENDGLPNHICEACLDLLNKAVLFKKRCEEMDSEFRRKLKEMQEARIEEQESFDSHNELEYENSVNNFDSDFSSFFSNDNENIGIMDEDCNDKYSDTIEVKDGFIDCLICSRSFIDKDEYKRHLSNCNSFFEKSCKEKQLKFSEEFPWLCDICGKSFKLKGNQSMHRMSHTDELPYSCDMCPYRGRTSYNLRSHIRTHTGERPYKCPHCPQKFINASNRKRHLTVHEKNRRYKCSICHKGISTKRALIDHEKSVHFGVKAYECEICKLCFSNMKNVRKHKIRIHKVRAKHGRKVCTYLRVDEEKKEKQSELQANHSGNEH